MQHHLELEDTWLWVSVGGLIFIWPLSWGVFSRPGSWPLLLRPGHSGGSVEGLRCPSSPSYGQGENCRLCWPSGSRCRNAGCWLQTPASASECAPRFRPHVPLQTARPTSDCTSRFRPHAPLQPARPASDRTSRFRRHAPLQTACPGVFAAVSPPPTTCDGGVGHDVSRNLFCKCWCSTVPFFSFTSSVSTHAKPLSKAVPCFLTSNPQKLWTTAGGCPQTAV